jgi:hypothetical protein
MRKPVQLARVKPRVRENHLKRALRGGVTLLDCVDVAFDGA